MSIFDGLHLCENCGDAYTLGRLCRACRDQEMIDNDGDVSLITDLVLPASEVTRLNKAAADLATATAALERIAVGGEQKLEPNKFLSSSEMTRYYIQRIERMKRIAADALARVTQEGGGDE